MKRAVLMALFALALPLAAYGNTVDFTNHNGVLTGGSTGLTLAGSELTDVDGLGGLGLVQGNLGTLNFSTGALTAGNLTTGATFASGGTFVITGNGTGNIPNGVIFNGSFSSAVTLTFEGTLPNGGELYEISGSISGIWYNGKTVSGRTFQDYVITGKNGFMGGSQTLGSGDTFISTSTVPEPGTLGLLGSGLVGLAGVVRKRMKA